MTFLFDTNILLHYVRKSALLSKIEQQFDPFGPGNEAWISAVSLGEIRSIAMQNQWGEKRTAQLDDFLLRFLVSDINFVPIIRQYAAIDAFSQARHPLHVSSFTARNMGKNDLWIAATASVLGATLLTTDADFDHLNGVFLPVAKVAMP